MCAPFDRSRMPAIFSLIALAGALGLLALWSWGRLAPLRARLRLGSFFRWPRGRAAASPAEPARPQQATREAAASPSPEPSTEFIAKDELFATADAARSSASAHWPRDEPATEFLQLDELRSPDATPPGPSEDSENGPTRVFSRAELSGAPMTEALSLDELGPSLGRGR